MSRRVCIDAGHGGTAPGAAYRGLLEKDVVLAVSKYAHEELARLDAGIWCCVTRTWDTSLTLEQRCQMANNMKVDCFLSVHCNADPDSDLPGLPEAKGEEIWIYPKSCGGLKLAQCLAKWVDEIFPSEPFRGVKESAGLYVLKHTRMPAALIEIGFIDQSSSQETFTDEITLRKTGVMIARGILNYLNGDPK